MGMRRSGAAMVLFGVSLLPAFGLCMAAELKSARESLDKGNALFAKYDFTRAIEAFTEAIRLDPKFAEAHRKRGVACNAAEEYDKALADLTEAIRLDPNDGEAYLDRSLSYEAKGQMEKAKADYAQAIAVCGKAIGRKPKNVQALILRGSAYNYTGDYDRSLADFTEAIRIAPTSAEAHHSRGNVHYLKGVIHHSADDHDQAANDWTEAIRLNSDSAASHEGLGLIHANKGEHDKAIAQFSRAIRVAPRCGGAYCMRGRSYRAKGDDNRPVFERMRRNAVGQLGLPDVEMGTYKLPGNDKPNTNEDDQPGNVELAGIVAHFAAAELPQCDAALNALANPKHPYYPLAVERVLRARPSSPDERVWFAHPFCLAILREALNDTKATGYTWRVEGDSLCQRNENGYSSESIPEFLADAAARRDEAAERACDTAALKINELVFGLPVYHPLLKDADARLATVKSLLDRYRNRFRAMTGTEARVLGLSLWDCPFVPGIVPLDRAATAADVAEGRAVFDLAGKGKPAELRLPAVAALMDGGKSKRPPKALVVQAEVDGDGKTKCGIIMAHEIRVVDIAELTGIKPVASEKQRNKR